MANLVGKLFQPGRITGAGVQAGRLSVENTRTVHSVWPDRSHVCKQSLHIFIRPYYLNIVERITAGEGN